ncbi:helix-turn-helix transcriptional regulator [uncultured Sphingomonas sp.]|uniref:helix-turn-helix transcriptional regulator n=1 Tax=uncultured Sphingomonas sp. TaxID=158754 RepID=UPI0034177B91
MSHKQLEHAAIPDRLLGSFSLRLLASIERLGDRATGANLLVDLSEKLGRDVAIGQLYLTLARLSDHGLISSEILNSEPVKGGRRKKLFKLETSGKRALNTMVV